MVTLLVALPYVTPPIVIGFVCRTASRTLAPRVGHRLQRHHVPAIFENAEQKHQQDRQHERRFDGPAPRRMRFELFRLRKTNNGMAARL